MDAVMRKHRGTLVRLRSLKPKPENNYNHQRKRTFLLEEEEESLDRRFHTPYFGRRASSVTQLYHGKPPPHSYHPSLLGTPPQCHNKKASSITDFVENYGKAKRTSDDLGWFGRTATDVSVHQRIVPCPHYGKRTDGPAPYYGRLATFVTDPYRYPGDPTWRSILHHWEEDKRNPKYPASSDEYPVCPQHVSPRELAAAVAAKRKSQYVVKKAWMTSVDRDKLDKERLLGLQVSPGSRCPPGPPYALQSVSNSTISTKSAQAAKTAAATTASPSAAQPQAPAASSLKSQASKSHADGSDHESSKKNTKKPGSPKSAGSHHSVGKEKCSNSPPPAISVSPCASSSGNQAGQACNSPRSELLSPTSEKSYKSSQKSPLPAPGSSRSGTRRPEEDSQCTKSHTTCGQGSSSKRTDHRREQGGSSSSSTGSSSSHTGCKSTSSKSRGTRSPKEVPFNPESITYEDLRQFPDVCATTSAWGGRFKDQERNKPWPVPYEQPHERRTHKKTSITMAPIVN